MAKDDNFFEKHKGKIGAAGLALNALQNQQIQKNQKELGKIQAENARLQKERNELLKKQIEEEEERKKKQYQLLKLAPQLKHFLQKLSDDQDREGKEIGLLIELCTQLHQYLYENDKYVNDVKFHEFLMEINPIIDNLKEKYQKEVEDYHRMVRELDLAIEEVRPLLNIIDFLEDIDVNYLYQDEVDHAEILEKCRVIRKKYDSIDNLISKLTEYIDFDPESKLSQVDYLNQDIVQHLVSLPTKEAIDIKQKLIGLPDKEWVQEKTSQVEEYISDIEKASEIKRKLKNPNPKYIFNQLINVLKDLSKNIRKKESQLILEELKEPKHALNNFKESLRPEELKKLHDFWGEDHYPEELVKNYSSRYFEELRKKHLNILTLSAVLVLVINTILFLRIDLQLYSLLIINVMAVFISFLCVILTDPNPNGFKEILEQVEKYNQPIHKKFKEIKSA